MLNDGLLQILRNNKDELFNVFFFMFRFYAYLLGVLPFSFFVTFNAYDHFHPLESPAVTILSDLVTSYLPTPGIYFFLLE